MWTMMPTNVKYIDFLTFCFKNDYLKKKAISLLLSIHIEAQYCF